MYTLHMIVRAKFGKDGMNTSNGDISTELPCIINNSEVSILHCNIRGIRNKLD